MRDGLAAPLAPLGFNTNRSQRKWVRDTGELLQLVFLEKHYGGFFLQWGLVCPALAEPTWGVPYREFDIGQAVVTGTPERIRWRQVGVGGGPITSSRFTEGDLEASSGEVAGRIREDVDIVEEYLRPFTSRRILREYLLANSDRSDPREFLIPSGLGLKLFVAAGLALLDGDPLGYELLVEAEKEFSPFTAKGINGKRSAALRRLADGRCDSLPLA